ncbi:hypothetical protein PROPHIGD102-1_66 [Mycobacterium phage prophiGD102-1]|nr:hypothetical protein PROPHIGD102-1_66 [Mycobacterium phage prophiGD102-1]
MRQFIIPRRPPGLAGFFISQNNPCGKSFGLSTAGAFSIPKRRFPHASVSCPLLHPLWPYPLHPLLYRVSSRSRERPNKLDRTGDRER